MKTFHYDIVQILIAYWVDGIYGGLERLLSWWYIWWTILIAYWVDGIYGGLY